MARVFVVREVALGRDIVVKVLPPEMGAGLNIDRFRREIQLAARLQDPHIVPLLFAGSKDDLLYYAMPRVEGETLRARFSDPPSCRSPTPSGSFATSPTPSSTRTIRASCIGT